MHPGMHIPCSGWPQCFKFEKIGEMVLVDGLISTYTSFGEMVLVNGLISTYTSGVLESMTLQIEDFIPPDHTRANYAGLVLHGAHR